MLCHDKKRQRLKEYINYKLNKYYTVIFTLIIWDFLSFLIYLLIYFIILPYVLMSSFQILTIFYFPLSSCHCWVYFTSQHQFRTKTNRVVSLHPQCFMYSERKAVLYRGYCTNHMWSMKMNLNQVGDVTPEEASTLKVLDNSKSHTTSQNWESPAHWASCSHQLFRRWMLFTFRCTMAALHECWK